VAVMTLHNYRQKRNRLMADILRAKVAVQHTLEADTPVRKRARTLAAKRLMERSRDLYRLLTR
jgi:hypothetical protein